jgi:hypothetical protein
LQVSHLLHRYDVAVVEEYLGYQMLQELALMTSSGDRFSLCNDDDDDDDE